jgi:hypothetical protein
MKKHWITIALLACALGLTSSGGATADGPTLEEARLTMSKWIETQQIISRERNDWQQGKEILLGRLELVRKETSTLDQDIRAAQAKIADSEVERDRLLAERAGLEAQVAHLAQAVDGMETELKKLQASLPEPILAKVKTLYERMPADDAARQRVSVSERFQNVLVILNELDKASGDITIDFEVHTLANGKPSEVKAIYVGLTQAYYVNADGQAGIGRPAAGGWQWEPTQTISNEVLLAFDILQGKQTPQFVGLPVKLP